MPIKETILRVFVSSPSDVPDERELVVATIEELNNTWSAHMGLRLTPILWETHCRPAVGSDSQRVINEQLPPDCEIFIGIMWKRFGTATPRFGSGTEEEFQTAYLRHKRNSKNVNVLFYFKDTPVSPSEIVPGQIKRVKDFKVKLGPKGVLYWHFNSIEEFRQLIRIHLSREMQQWFNRANKVRKPQSKQLIRQSAAKHSAVVAGIDLATLRKRSDEKKAMVVEVFNRHITASKAYIRKLKNALKVAGRNEQDLVKVLIKASRAYYLELEPAVANFSDLMASSTEAIIDEFIAKLLLGTISRHEARQFIRRVNGMVKILLEGSCFYLDGMDQGPYPDSWKSVPDFSLTIRKENRLFKSFGNELKTAAKLVTEAKHVAETLMLKKLASR